MLSDTIALRVFGATVFALLLRQSFHPNVVNVIRSITRIRVFIGVSFVSYIRRCSRRLGWTWFHARNHNCKYLSAALITLGATIVKDGTATDIKDILNDVRN